MSQYDFGVKIRAIAQEVRKWEKGVSEPPAPLLAKIQRLVTAYFADTK